MSLVQVIKLSLSQGLARARSIASNLVLHLGNGSSRSDSSSWPAGSCPHRGGKLPPQNCGADRGAGSVEGSSPRGDEVDTFLEGANARHGDSMLLGIESREKERKDKKNGREKVWCPSAVGEAQRENHVAIGRGRGSQEKSWFPHWAGATPREAKNDGRWTSISTSTPSYI
jgi:hypothetical protein